MRPRRGNWGCGGGLGPRPSLHLPLSRGGLTGGGIRWKATGKPPRRGNPGVLGRAWPSPDPFSSPSPAAAGEGAGGGVRSRRARLRDADTAIPWTPTLVSLSAGTGGAACRTPLCWTPCRTGPGGGSGRPAARERRQPVGDSETLSGGRPVGRTGSRPPLPVRRRPTPRGRASPSPVASRASPWPSGRRPPPWSPPCGRRRRQPRRGAA